MHSSDPLCGLPVEQFLSDRESLFARTYQKPPILFVRGEGCYLFDHAGNRYLDFTAGIAVSALGHAHPALLRAISHQAATLIHTSNMFAHPLEISLARELTRRSGMKRVFLCNSGTEAIEGALKVSRLRASKTGSAGKFEIIATERSFHGRSLGSLSVTGQPKYHQGFQPLLPGVKFVPYNDVHALRAAFSKTTAAFICEPIQAEAGIYPATREYLQNARSLCDEFEATFILDEVQTGIGRTGTLFCFEAYGVRPDVVAVAKGLGGGVPIGAILFGEAVSEVFEPGNHATTFGGGPLASAAALAVLRTIDEKGLLENVRRAHDYLKPNLEELKRKHPKILDIRGSGLLLGIELSEPATPIFERLRDHQRVLVSRILPNVIRLVPPLIVQTSECDEFLLAFESALS